MKTKIVIPGLQSLLNKLTEVERVKAVAASKASMAAIGLRGQHIEKEIIRMQDLIDTAAMYSMTSFVVRARTKDRKGHFAVIGQKPNTVEVAGSKKRRWSTLVLTSLKYGGGLRRRQPVKYNYMVDRGTSHSRAFHFVEKTESVLKVVASKIAVKTFRKYLGL